MTIRAFTGRKSLVAALVAATLLSGCTSSDSGVVTEPVNSSVATSVSGSLTPASVTEVSPSSSASATSEASAEPITTEASPSSTQPWPADFTPEQQQTARAALAAIAGFTDVVARANADPGQDWAASIRTYAADPAAKLSLQSIQSLATAGVHATAPSTYENPTVLSAEDIRAVADVCVDRSKATLVDAEGATVLGPPDVPRSVVTYTVVKYAPADGGWLVTETAASDPVRTC